MPKKAGIFIMAIGAVLICSALLLLKRNQSEDEAAGEIAASILVQVEAAATQRSGAAQSPKLPPPKGLNREAEEPAEPLDPEMPVVVIDGYGYIGYVEFPTLDIRLPVMAEWDYNRLLMSPCRQFGSTRTDDLVLAAHHYKTHFGNIKELPLGEIVLFTDMDGILNVYEIAEARTLHPSEVDAVQNSGYPLVIYTCTNFGQERYTIFCSRTDKWKGYKDTPTEEAK